MSRDHVAIAKKAARTRARMKEARGDETERKRVYDRKRRLDEIRRYAYELIADRAGLGSREFQSSVRK
jgi:hypothetical protein